MRRFMGTRAFKVYFLVFLHGVGMCAFELCNKAIPVIVKPKIVYYIYETKNGGNQAVLTANAAGSADSNYEEYTVVQGDKASVTLHTNLTTNKTVYTRDNTDKQGSKVTVTNGTAETLVTLDKAAGNTNVAVVLDDDNKIINVTGGDNQLANSQTNATTVKTGTDNGTITRTIQYDYDPTKTSDTDTPGKVNIDLNDTNRGLMITYNILVFCVTNLIVIWFFSFVRYFIHRCARLALSFILASIIFMIGQIPILYYFHKGIEDARTTLDTEYAKVILIAKVKRTNGKNVVVSKIKIPCYVSRKPAGELTKEHFIDIADLKILVQLCCLTIFHGTVFFWIFTGGPLTFYVSDKILREHEFMKAWGVPFILIGFAGATVGFGYTVNFSNHSGKAQEIVFTPEFKKGVLFLCIATQFFTLLFLRPYDCLWNKFHWYNFFILVMTGVTNTMFVTYIYIVLDDVAKIYYLNWVCYGVFFSATNFVISRAMGIMFGAFACEGTTGFKISSINAVIGHNFPCVYKAITVMFQLLNLMALLPICTSITR